MEISSYLARGFFSWKNAGLTTLDCLNQPDRRASICLSTTRSPCHLSDCDHKIFTRYVPWAILLFLPRRSGACPQRKGTGERKKERKKKKRKKEWFVTTWRSLVAGLSPHHRRQLPQLRLISEWHPHLTCNYLPKKALSTLKTRAASALIFLCPLPALPSVYGLPTLISAHASS
jgi:hypothetical protein